MDGTGERGKAEYEYEILSSSLICDSRKQKILILNFNFNCSIANFYTDSNYSNRAPHHARSRLHTRGGLLEAKRIIFERRLREVSRQRKSRGRTFKSLFEQNVEITQGSGPALIAR